MTDPGRGQEPAQPSARATATGRFERERRRRKLILLALLLILLLLVGYSAYYFNTNKRLPLQGVDPAAAQLAPPEYLFSITGSGAETLTRPIGVGYYGGRLYVVDFGDRVVRVFDRNGRHQFKFNAIAGGTLRNPVHLAIDSKGRIWVTDRRLEGIYVFDRDGKFLFEFEPKGRKGMVWTPLAVGFDPEDNLLVTDVGSTTQHQVFTFAEDGRQLQRFGKTVQVADAKASPGGFFFPNGVTGVEGLVFISDGDNRRVQVFGRDDGRFRYFVATSGTPRGIAIDGEKRVYVVDALAHQVDIYDVKGAKLVQFGEQGFGPGQFNFPNDVALDDTGRIYVTDRENNQVQVWGWPRAEPPAALRPRKAWQWALCLSPLLLLLLPLLRRTRRYAVTEDFIDEMERRERVAVMDRRGVEWVVPEAEHDRYVGRVTTGVDLGALLRGEPHSPSDAEDLVHRLEVDEPTAVMLTIARRAKRLCTQDADIRGLAVLLDIDVYDVDEFLEKHREGSGRAGGSQASDSV